MIKEGHTKRNKGRLACIEVSATSADAISPLLREVVLRPEGRKIEEAHGPVEGNHCRNQLHAACCQALHLLLKQRCLFPVVPRDPPQVYRSKSCQIFGVPFGAEPGVRGKSAVSGLSVGWPTTRLYLSVSSGRDEWASRLQEACTKTPPCSVVHCGVDAQSLTVDGLSIAGE